MKKINKLIMIIFIFSISLFAMEGVHAATPPKTLKMTGTGGRITNLGIYFPRKYLGNSIEAFCMDFRDSIPHGKVMKLVGKNNVGVTAIIQNGFKKGGSDRNYWITSMAIHFYNDRRRGIKDTKNGILKASQKAKILKSDSDGGIGKAVMDLVKIGLSAKVEKATLTVNSSSNALTLSGDKKYYTTGNISVTGTGPVSNSYTLRVSGISGYEVTDTNGNKKSSFKLNELFRIRIPAGNVKVGNSTLNISASGVSTVANTYRYTIDNSKYQDLTPVTIYNDTTQIYSANKAFNVTKTMLKITKTDITGEQELDGAHLVVKDQAGHVIDEWVSKKGEAHYIEGLTNGATYTLEETIAPDGYYMSTAVNFTIQNGSVTTVNMRDNITKVVISKQDITSKKEIPGAHLVIKDEEGNVVQEWDSTEEPHDIEGLLIGKKYTLEETIAPDGYILNQEKVEFEIDPSGQATNIVMFNEITKTYISKQSITSKKELPGAHLVIKDEEGNVVQEWDSTTEPRYIEGLIVGKKYTLEETVAPKGYTINREKIEFEVDPSGKPTRVVMYDQEVVKVPETASNVPTAVYIAGFGCILGGLGVIRRRVRQY